MKYCKNFIASKCVAQTGLCDMFCEHMFDHGVFGFLAEEIYQTYAVIIDNYVLCKKHKNMYILGYSLLQTGRAESQTPSLHVRRGFPTKL